MAADALNQPSLPELGEKAAYCNFWDRCHFLAAFNPALINVCGYFDFNPSGSLSIHTTTGWRQKRMDWLYVMAVHAEVSCKHEISRQMALVSLLCAGMV